MRKTLKGKYFICDTESNGPSRFAEVWQVAWQVTDTQGQCLKKGNGYLAPQERMSHEAIVITGLTRTSLKKLAEPADDVYMRLVQDIQGAKAIIGHSVDIDVCRLINDAGARCSPVVSEAVRETFEGIPYYDTMAHTIDFVGKRITKMVWHHGYPVTLQKTGCPSLVELARKLAVDFAGIALHTADGDTELTRRCLVRMLETERELVQDLVSNAIVNPPETREWEPTYLFNR